MALNTGQVTPQVEVRRLTDVWAEAIRRKDLEGLMALHAPGLVAFDAWGPLRIDAATTRDHWDQCFAGHEGPIDLELRDLHIVAGEEVAFCHCLIGMRGRLRGGGEHSFWGRGTMTFQRVGGRWQITHTHASAPFDPMSGAACTDLQP